MLEANKSKLFEKIFSVYNRNLLKRRFYSFQVSGLDFLLNKNINTPLIIYCNHSSWWDGLIAFQISHETALDSFVMMEEKHLKKFFLFRKLGAFSIIRENPREALKSVDYAAKLLTGKLNRTLWIFPQGEILPNDLRPIRFYNGLAKIIKKAGFSEVTSLSIRYEFLGGFKPQIFVKIEKPELISVNADFNVKQLTLNLTENLTDNLNTLKSDIINHNLADYREIF
ncbi:MAG TPA: lysophospholipid acyltransferase family protein [Pyrinomonadaceae bacterium]|nr:lysophospholipid acyltransferase family protein [Pyrinomonadaceae bacterium]